MVLRPVMFTVCCVDIINACFCKLKTEEYEVFIIVNDWRKRYMAHWKAYTYSNYNDYLQWKVVNKRLEDSFVIRLVRYTVNNVLKECWSVGERMSYRIYYFNR